jgi:protein disulfide-isomerase A6
MTRNLLVLSLALIPSLVSAAIFPSNSIVKMLDEKGFRKAMKTNVSRLGAVFEAGV